MKLTRTAAVLTATAVLTVAPAGAANAAQTWASAPGLDAQTWASAPHLDAQTWASAPLAAQTWAADLADPCGDYCGTDHIPAEEPGIIDQALDAIAKQIDDIRSALGF